jgi:hypothetical protein
MDKQRLDAIRARCEAATPGPWRDGDYGQMVWATNPYGHGDMRVADVRGWGHLTGVGTCNFTPDKAAEIQDANYAFIAHARTDVPDLLAEVERLNEELTLERAYTDFWKDAAEKARKLTEDVVAVSKAWRRRAEAAEMRIKRLDRLIDTKVDKHAI